MFRGSMAGLPAPLSTLRRTPHDVLRMTRELLSLISFGNDVVKRIADGFMIVEFDFTAFANPAGKVMDFFQTSVC